MGCSLDCGDCGCQDAHAPEVLRGLAGGLEYWYNHAFLVKLESVKKAGYRTVSIAGRRAPIMIRQIEPSDHGGHPGLSILPVRYRYLRRY